MWSQLSWDGIIYLPYFSYIVDNLTPRIRSLYDVKVVTDQMENPLMKVGFDIQELSEWNKSYACGRTVNGVKGFCISLCKKPDPEQERDAIEDYLKNNNHDTSEFVIEWFMIYCEVGIEELKTRLVNSLQVDVRFASKLIEYVIKERPAIKKSRFDAEMNMITTLCNDLSKYTVDPKPPFYSFKDVTCDAPLQITISNRMKEFFPITFQDNHAITFDDPKLRRVLSHVDYMPPSDFLDIGKNHKNVLYSLIKVACSNIRTGNVNITYFSGCQMKHPDCGDDVVCVFLFHFCCCNFSISALCYSKSLKDYFLLRGKAGKPHDHLPSFRCDTSAVVDNLQAIIDGGDDYLLRSRLLYSIYSLLIILLIMTNLT